MIEPDLWGSGHDARFFRVRMRSGEVHIGAAPTRAGQPFVPKTDPQLLRWMSEQGHGCIDEIPIERDLIDGVCGRCGAPGVEMHHWAPRVAFGDADDWPIGDLCPPCHVEWHERMDAWADGKCPLGWEGVEIVE